MKKYLLFGAIVSIITTNAIANQVITSQTYVDNQDALKQDKITAGTTGNVVLYNGTSNGQTQFTGRAIYDGSNDYDETTDANKLITAGAVDGMVGDVYDYVDDEISNIPAPELPTGMAGSIVTYDENGDIGGELEPGWVAFNGDPEASVPGLVAADGGGGFTGSQFGILNQIMAAGGLSTDVTIESYQSRGSGAADDGTNMDNFVPTVRAVAIGLSKKQAKKTCAGWMDGTTTPDATHTDANCVLWNLPN